MEMAMVFELHGQLELAVTAQFNTSVKSTIADKYGSQKNGVDR